MPTALPEETVHVTTEWCGVFNALKAEVLRLRAENQALRRLATQNATNATHDTVVTFTFGNSVHRVFVLSDEDGLLHTFEA